MNPSRGSCLISLCHKLTRLQQFPLKNKSDTTTDCNATSVLKLMPLKMSAQGIFLDVFGLSYRSGALSGTISSDYQFSYEPGYTVTFSIGGLVLGQSIGKPLITVSDLLPGSTSISDPRLINRARLLYSLTPAQGFEQPIVIDERVSSMWQSGGVEQRI